jgi:hypothetical protein
MVMKWKSNPSTSEVLRNKSQTINQLGGTTAIKHALQNIISKFPELFRPVFYWTLTDHGQT